MFEKISLFYDNETNDIIKKTINETGYSIKTRKLISSKKSVKNKKHHQI